jgi:formate dehydrogenase subunit gamma
MHRPADAIPRFSPVETWVHRTTSALVGVLVATGAVLYLEPLALLIGRRLLVEGVHVVAGLVLPFPMLVGLWRSPELRADVRALGRMSHVDVQWLRRRDRRRAGLGVGKFNGGQKLAASTLLGAGLVLFGTGLLLLGPARINLPVSVREGATVTHDLFTFGIVLLLAGHLWLAFRHPEARAALRHGHVDRDYAEREHPAWVAEVTGQMGVTGLTQVTDTTR